MTRAEIEFLEARRSVANSKLTDYRRQAWRLSGLGRQQIVPVQGAVDCLWEIAIAHALVRALGEGRIEAILAEAFAESPFERAV